MVIALFGVPDHQVPSLNSRGKASQDSSQLTISATPCLSAGFPSQTRPVSAISLLAAEKSIGRLRLDLIEMLRISLYAVDYATKAYALGLVELALSAPRGRKKLEHLGQTIIATTQQLCETEELDDSQLGFIESARAISAALSSTCQHAYEVSSPTVALLRGDAHRNSKELVHLGERANRLLRLCIVAFMKQKIEYAEAVLRDIEEWRRAIKEKQLGPGCSASAMITSDVHEWSITASLAQIMENLDTIAVAALLPYPFSVETPSRDDSAHICNSRLLQFSQSAFGE